MSHPRSHWKTPKGTDLALINLKGKEYLPVAQRIVWFREEFPLGRIETHCLLWDGEKAHFQAEIFVPTQSGQYVKLADGNKVEHKKDFPDYAEKAQTAAIGRALALCGFGTQFCADELDEQNRLADTPHPPRGESNTQTNPLASSHAPVSSGGTKAKGLALVQDGLDFKISFGQYKGKTLREIPQEDLMGYISYLEAKAKKDNKPIDPHSPVGQLMEAYLTVYGQKLPQAEPPLEDLPF